MNVIIQGSVFTFQSRSKKSLVLLTLTTLAVAAYRNDSKGARIYVGASHTQNGDNDRKYEFGEDTTVTLGGTYQTQTPWGFNLELLYRKADRNQRDSVEIPNTGGE